MRNLCQRSFRHWESLWASSVEDDECWAHLVYASDKSGDEWLAPLVVIFVYISIWSTFSVLLSLCLCSIAVTVTALPPTDDDDVYYQLVYVASRYF